MRNILDELYDYGLFHLTEIETFDDAYNATLDRLVKAEVELRKNYPDNNEIIDAYQPEDIDLHNFSNHNGRIIQYLDAISAEILRRCLG